MHHFEIKHHHQLCWYYILTTLFTQYPSKLAEIVLQELLGHS